jgi:predicted nucleotidyltransferase
MFLKFSSETADKHIFCTFTKKKEMPSDRLITEIISILKLQGIEKLILFGSYASGNPTPESDIDLLAIKDIPENKIRNFRIQLKKALWNKLASENMEFDVLVDSEDRIKQRIAMGDLFYSEIFNNGKVLYAK